MSQQHDTTSSSIHDRRQKNEDQGRDTRPLPSNPTPTVHPVSAALEVNADAKQPGGEELLAAGTNSTLSGANGKVLQPPLEKIMDTNGNFNTTQKTMLSTPSRQSPKMGNGDSGVTMKESKLEPTKGAPPTLSTISETLAPPSQLEPMPPPAPSQGPIPAEQKPAKPSATQQAQGEKQEHTITSELKTSGSSSAATIAASSKSATPKTVAVPQHGAKQTGQETDILSEKASEKTLETDPKTSAKPPAKRKAFQNHPEYGWYTQNRKKSYPISQEAKTSLNGLTTHMMEEVGMSFTQCLDLMGEINAVTPKERPSLISQAIANFLSTEGNCQHMRKKFKRISSATPVTAYSTMMYLTKSVQLMQQIKRGEIKPPKRRKRVASGVSTSSAGATSHTLKTDLAAPASVSSSSTNVPSTSSTTPAAAASKSAPSSTVQDTISAKATGEAASVGKANNRSAIEVITTGEMATGMDVDDAKPGTSGGNLKIESQPQGEEAIAPKASETKEKPVNESTASIQKSTEPDETKKNEAAGEPKEIEAAGEPIKIEAAGEPIKIEADAKNSSQISADALQEEYTKSESGKV